MNPLPAHRYLHRIAPTPMVPLALTPDSPLIWCKLEFSRDVPGVIDGCSRLYSTWKKTTDAKHLRELRVSDERCMEITQQLWRMGFPVGPSSGLNLGAALLHAREAAPNSVIVTVFPDRMERYFSHKVFESIARS